ncbi:hypothetical protein [Amycolatopsis thermoflava]|uniref:hypothetical protein n=1 Tax=Amycolatopsis thermoflava TaxID=84480 RepID=UPI00382428A1
MNPIGWWIAANTVVTSVAVILAVLAWRRQNHDWRQARNVVCAYEPLVKRHEDTTALMLPLLEDRLNEVTMPHEPVEDDQPTGRHARLEPTELLPATGQLAATPPAYYFAAVKETS